MIFHATDAPLGAAPDQDGDAKTVFSLCVDATSGFIPAIDAINANAEHLNEVGQGLAKEKLRASRAEPLTARAPKLIAREKLATASAGHELKAAAGLNAPAADSAAAWRAQETRAAYLALSPSERNAVLNGPDTDTETLLAIYHAPALTNTLSARDRQAVEDKLIERHDPQRHAAHAKRVEDVRRAEYALGVALGFVGRNRVAGIRERIGAEPESPGVAGIRERLLAANKAD